MPDYCFKIIPNNENHSYTFQKNNTAGTVLPVLRWFTGMLPFLWESYDDNLREFLPCPVPSGTGFSQQMAGR